jgi:hypothetical protein
LSGPNVWAILAGQPEGDLSASAHSADLITEAAIQHVIASVLPLIDGAALLQHIENISRQVGAFNAEQDPPSVQRQEPSPG